jgi:class 3 adenylate cyclase
MDSKLKLYDFEASFKRIDGILAQGAGDYTEVDELPSRDDLTYTNGFYAYCSALFIDIRDSSSLPSKAKTRPVLAKIYRSFISETVAIFNSDPHAREVNIVGDCVWGVYNTPKKPHIDGVFQLAYEANSLVKVLNYKLGKKGYPTIAAGIGMAYGRALMIKAGYNGSGINDVIYMGDVVNEAAKLAARGSKGFAPALMVQHTFYANLKPGNQAFLQRATDGVCMQGNVVQKGMEAWYDENCK